MPQDRQPDATSPPPRAAGLARTWPVLLAAALGGYYWGSRHPTPAPVPAQVAPVAAAARVPRAVPLPQPAPHVHVPRHAWFGDARPSADARHVADWVVDSGDAGARSFVIVDKKAARVYVFEPSGWLLADAPALLGAAVGDDPVPGIGEKPLSQVKPEEKTTPAGRFVAELGVNSHGEDIVWVSYDLAVSLHRVRPLVKAERRLQRLASPTPRDNRISFGCINLPPKFYEQVLRPTVAQTGAIVYVLPETRTPQEQFGSYDVVDPGRMAGALSPASVKKATLPRPNPAVKAHIRARHA